ncbi:MAG: hypothetical protein AUI47_02685 [Acidobacteria bacterium 13_1_40CM_2_68_5]|nr:MAG: hypothetical protein AUI47_02685 [Acidobacteria bacterium 13_1_40CM_2_68_5]
MSARGRVAVLFRSALGFVFLAAFLSMAVQLRDLAGSRGLLPWADFLGRLSPGTTGALTRFLSFPTLFLWLHHDAALTLVPSAGAAIAILLMLGLGGRVVPFVLWFLYLSCVMTGRDFFYYQWDNRCSTSCGAAVCRSRHRSSSFSCAGFCSDSCSSRDSPRSPPGKAPG